MLVVQISALCQDFSRHRATPSVAPTGGCRTLTHLPFGYTYLLDDLGLGAKRGPY